jgi:glycosyltransferase involved in cell wall biosynthesis
MNNNFGICIPTFNRKEQRSYITKILESIITITNENQDKIVKFFGYEILRKQRKLKYHINSRGINEHKR